MRTFVITFFAVAIVAAFLSPLIRAATVSVKTSGQISQTNGPIYPALVVIGIWGIGAGIIINLAGLQGIPTELYDAATIDGAGWWSSLRHITLPMMSPVIFYTLTLGIVEVLQYFLVALVINNGTGDPAGATLLYNLYLYKVFFAYQDMSYGATLAWLLFVITLTISLLLFWSARRWVYYAGER
jgi:ABC-type sugar transport system permease subunit